MAVMLVLLMEEIYKVRRWDRLRWHDVLTKFHEDWYRYLAIWRFCLINLKSCNIGITGGEIYGVRRWNGLRWHDIHTKFQDDWFKHLSNITVIIAIIWEDVMLVLLIEGIYAVHRWDGFMWHDISFMKIGIGFQAILMFCFRNLKGCNVGTGGMNL
jgi:hypothetical protein